MAAAIDISKAFSCYPAQSEIDLWAKALLRWSLETAVEGTFTEHDPILPHFGNCPNTLENRYVRFQKENGNIFWGYWQSAIKQPAPLLINLPGYGGRISMHPQIADDHYNILHISPLGYVSPTEIDVSRALPDGSWPVLHNTAAGLPGDYTDWLLDCLLAIRWAAAQPNVLPDRISLFGTSQGGGSALLLASILGDSIRCACADVPFLTAFPLSQLRGDAYGLLRRAYETVDTFSFWNRLGYVDTVSHAHRLTMPILLTSGGKDTVCPAETVEYLFGLLPGTKQYTYLQQNVHTHSRQSMYLFRCWLNLFA